MLAFQFFIKKKKFFLVCCTPNHDDLMRPLSSNRGCWNDLCPGPLINFKKNNNVFLTNIKSQIFVIFLTYKFFFEDS